MKSVLREVESLWWEGFVNEVGFKPAVKESEGAIDDESGEMTGEEVTGAGQGESENRE